MENRKWILRKKALLETLLNSLKYLTHFRKNVLPSQVVQKEGQMVLPHTVQIKENIIEIILILIFRYYKTHDVFWVGGYTFYFLTPKGTFLIHKFCCCCFSLIFRTICL